MPILLLEKRWALSENFAEFVQFVARFGVKDLSIHLQSAPRNVIYLSFLSVSDIMEKKTSNNFEQKLIDSLILEKKITLLADESTDVCIVWEMEVSEYYPGSLPWYYKC